MAHPSVEINGVVYPNVPEVEIPIDGGGVAKFYDASETDITPSDVLSGKKGIGPNGEVNGNIQSKAAATILPSGSDQTIAGSQYLAGAQTIKAVICTNLAAQYIAKDVVVKVGCSEDDDSVTSVTGTLATPIISQDSTTKVLSIS